MVIDLILLIVAAYGFYIGYSKGIVQTVFNVLSIVFGLLAAFKFSPAMTDFLEDVVGSYALMFVAGFLLTFVLTMVLIRFFARGIEGFFKTTHINIFNQIAGGILLSAVMILLYSVVLWFANESRILVQESKEESMSYTYLEEYPALVWKLGAKFKPTFEEFWDHSIDFMDRLKGEMQARQEEQSTEEIYDIDEETGNRERRN